ncbi:MAG: hypothetical protein ABL962_05020 [Fimbriimonadaceae bacterium]
MGSGNTGNNNSSDKGPERAPFQSASLFRDFQVFVGSQGVSATKAEETEKPGAQTDKGPRSFGKNLAPDMFRLEEEDFKKQTGGPAYLWNPGDLDKHTKSLAVGVLLLACGHDDVLHAAKREVATASEFRSHKVFSIYPMGDDVIDLNTLLNEAENLKANDERNPEQRDVVFVVEATRRLLPMLPDLSLRLQGLNGRGIHILFMVQLKWLDERENTNWHAGLNHWSIDALPLLLQQYRGEMTDEELLCLVAQCRPPGNRVRTVRDELELLGMVDQCLREDGIEAVKEALKEGRLDGRAKSAQVAEARIRWAKIGPIERAALFLAVSIPSLTWESFEQLMPALLAGKDETGTKTTPVQPSKEEPNPVPRIDTVIMPALKRWQEAPHSLLSEAGLCCVEGPGSDMVQFIDLAQEAALHEALTFYGGISKEMYDALHAHGIYFDPETPDATVVALASATRRLVTRAGQSYNEHWLFRRVRDIQRWVSTKKEQEARSIETGSLEQLFKSLLRAEENGRNLESFFFNRLCDLCSELLSTPKTALVVDRFIQLMVQDSDASGHHILQVVRRLKGHEAFGHLRWIKHLFDCGDTATCQGTLQLLFSERSEPRRFWEVCLEMTRWLPVGEEPIRQQSQRWALAFLPLWFLDTMQRHQVAMRREPASRAELPLFVELADLPPLAERLQAASKLLCHPLFPEAAVWVLKRVKKENAARPEGNYHAEVEEDEDNELRPDQIDYLLAEMLERCQDLLGDSSAIPIWAEQLKDSLPRSRLVRVREFLRWKANHHQSQRGTVPSAERPVIDRLVRQARHLEKLLYPVSIATKTA